MTRGARYLLPLLLLAFLLPVAEAQETPGPRIRIGISMERSSSRFDEQIAALQAFFQRVSNGQFTLYPLPPDELMQAIRNRQLDAAFLNPYQIAYAQYLDQRARPLVTFEANMPGGRVAGVGGVILVRRENTDIRELQDLRDRQVAVPGRTAFGGYAAPLYELHSADPKLPGSLRITATGTHRNALEAVLDGTVDAAFIDTLVLEQLVADGVLARDAVRVINTQKLPAYPAVTSTRLYPGWALVALPNLTAAQTDTVLAVLLDVRRRSIGGLHGSFSLSPSYEPVHRILQELSLPPYHRATGLSWQDIWRTEPLTMLLWASITVALFLLAGFLFVYARRIRVLFQQEKLNARRERALRDMPIDVEPVDILPFLRAQLDVISELTCSRFAGIYRVNAESREIEAYAMAATALTEAAAEPLDSLPLVPGGGWAESSATASALTLNDYRSTRHRQPLPGAPMTADRLLLSPVEAGSGALILGVANKSTPYDAQDLQTVELLCAQIWRTVRRSEAEAHLAARDREARASAELLQGIFDSFAGGIIVYSGSGGIQLVNPMAAEFFGISATDAIGHTLNDYGWRLCDRDGQLLDETSAPIFRVQRHPTPIN
ncbi:MAG: PhnD/SsuA/transferrin family substrate-binding protein, partial [Chromatocurvus sp.]